MFIDSFRPKEYVLEDIIQRFCRNCSFQWNEKPLDVPIDAPVFKVGDRVEVITGRWIREIGTVRGHSETIIGLVPGSIAVEFNKYHAEKHSCSNLCKNKYGYWLNPPELKHLTEEEVEK